MVDRILTLPYDAKLAAEYASYFGDKWHGLFGHLNLLTPDHESAVTGYGKHDTVVAYLPDHNGLYCLVLHRWNLGMPTPEQVLEVARKDQGIRGKWLFSHCEKWDDGSKTDFYFTKG